MSDTEPVVEIAYRTTIEVPRTGPVGRFLRWLGEHPLRGGLISGIVVVAIAMLARPAGVAAEPVTAAILSAIVVATWMVLFFLMRGFFKAQSFMPLKVLQQIIVDEDKAQWLRQGEPLREIDNPVLRLTTNPVPEGIGEHDKGSMRKATAWPVWIVIEDGEDPSQRLVFETRDAARRARDYEEVTDDIIDGVDERLPRAIAAPLLRHIGGSEPDEPTTTQ